jgi:hypothetical protein
MPIKEEDMLREKVLNQNSKQNSGKRDNRASPKHKIFLPFGGPPADA